jgi:trehalose 6-phosphate synthase
VTVDRPLVIVSNRGPLSFSRDADGGLVTKRAGGGLVTALGAGVAERGALWVAAAMTDEDREAAAAGTIEAEGYRLRTVVVDPDRYRQHYDVISNATLWFLHHDLFDRARRPRLDRRWREAWGAFRSVNADVAATVAEVAPEGADVLVHDYHLPLLGPALRDRRPDLRAVHFSHTPFCGPDALRLLPADVAAELLEGMAAHRACGFHTSRWAANFTRCCEDVLGWAPPTFVAPAAADPDDIAAVAASAACRSAADELDAALGDRRFLVRVDRIELSKNLLRGFHAFDDLLREHPEWRGNVVFGAFVYPSREGLAEYLAYRQEVEGLVRRINETWGTPDWTPVLYDADDDFPRSVAALRRYDALLVNPIRDGLNLVAKEGPLVNERDGVLCLSRESGAWEELAGTALEVQPYDVAGTADVLHAALSMGADERRDHAAAVREVAARRRPADWLADQLAAAEGAPPAA